MSTLQRAIESTKRIVENAEGFSTLMVFTAPTGEEVTVGVTFFKVFIPNLDGEGVTRNTEEAHCNVIESTLQDLSYPTRKNGVVSFQGHLVTVTDTSGVRTFKVVQWHPDSSLGHIVLMLQNYQP